MQLATSAMLEDDIKQLFFLVNSKGAKAVYFGYGGGAAIYGFSSSAFEPC